MGIPVLMPQATATLTMYRSGSGWVPVTVQDERTTETANLPAVWVEKLPCVFGKPRRFRIERLPKSPDEDVTGIDTFPWYVEEITYGDDRDDYGRMATYAECLNLVASMLKGDRRGI